MASSAMKKLILNSLASSCTSRKRSFTSDTGKLPFHIGHVERVEILHFPPDRSHHFLRQNPVLWESIKQPLNRPRKLSG